MNYSQETEDTYIVAWTKVGLLRVINMTMHLGLHFIKILRDDPDAGWVSNPIRDLIVTAVSEKITGFELWEVNSQLSETDIIEEFKKSPNAIMGEIRECGKLIYST